MAISAAGAGAGIGIPFAIADCADRTLNFGFDQVDRATPKVLAKMAIVIQAESETENGKRITASTKKLEITIDMERVTARATRVTINAKRGTLSRDKATSEEIINQLEKSLEGEGRLKTENTRVTEKSPEKK